MGISIPSLGMRIYGYWMVNLWYGLTVFFMATVLKELLEST
jgi:hypothetical protein